MLVVHGPSGRLPSLPLPCLFAARCLRVRQWLRPVCLCRPCCPRWRGAALPRLAWRVSQLNEARIGCVVVGLHHEGSVMVGGVAHFLSFKGRIKNQELFASVGSHFAVPVGASQRQHKEREVHPRPPCHSICTGAPPVGCPATRPWLPPARGCLCVTCEATGSTRPPLDSAVEIQEAALQTAGCAVYICATAWWREALSSCSAAHTASK